MKQWFETLDDDIWFPSDEAGVQEVGFIRRVLRLRRGHQVLDAPCGAGRIAVPLAKAGCCVTGVDRNKRFIDSAGAQFQRERLTGTFAVNDLRQIDFSAAFHGVFSWFASFGYFSDSENADLLQRYARALRRGGRLLIDQPNREHILRNFERVQVEGRVVMRGRWDQKAQRLIVRRVIDGTQDPRNTSSMRLYTPRQMQALYEQAGLVLEDRYGSEEGDRYTRSSPHMISVGRKP